MDTHLYLVPTVVKAVKFFSVTVTVDAAFPAKGRLEKDFWPDIVADTPGDAIRKVLDCYPGSRGNVIHKITVTAS